jgi:hypothetical protein
MKFCGTIFLLFVVSGKLLAQEAWSDKTRLLPDQLRKIPVAITIFHTPNPNYPELNSEQEKGTYVWKHSTFVRSETEDLEVIAAGSFIWYSKEGWVTNIQYSQQEFAAQFACKGAVLKKGKTYSFQKNYRYGNQLYGGDALWFVLAKDKNGKIYKGIGLIETEAQLFEE